MEPTHSTTGDSLIANAEHDLAQKLATASLQEPSAKLLSEYHLQLSRLVTRIEDAATHYQVLGLKMAATYDEVVRAYYSVLNLFYPAQQIRISLDGQTIERLDMAFLKVSAAFMTLANFKKRADYHNEVLHKAAGSHLVSTPPVGKPLTPPPASTLQTLHAAHTATTGMPRPPAPATAAPLSQRTMPQQMPVTPPRTVPQSAALPVGAEQKPNVAYSEFAVENIDGNRRRTQRLKLSIPVRLTGYEKNGDKWSEMCESVDVSRVGVTVHMRKNVRHGQVFYLNLPLPTKLRSHGFSDASYNVYSLVRRVEPEHHGQRVVALEFMGEQPPKGFLEKPWSIFRSSNWTGTERRRSPRVNRQERVSLEYFDSNARSISREETITENVSATGMRLFVKFAPPYFDLVLVSCVSRRFESLAVVRNRYIAKDGAERLCVQFLKRDRH